MAYDRQKVITIAKAEVGYLEKSKSAYTKNPAILDQKTAGAGYDNYTKYGRDMSKIYPAVMDFPAAWCDAFVDWCFYQAYGIATAKSLLGGNFDDYTIESAKMYRKHNALDTKAEVGSQIFFSSTGTVEGIYHTGLVIAVNGSTVTTIEGNTSATGAGIEANGGCVAQRTRTVSKKTLFGHPNYGDAQEKTMTSYIATVTTKKDNLNIRKGTGTSYAIVDAFPTGIPKGTQVRIDKESGGWGRLAGTDFWVYLKHVTK